MDTTETNNLPLEQEAVLEETLTDAVNETADNQTLEIETDAPEKVKTKRVTKAKISPAPEKTGEESAPTSEAAEEKKNNSDNAETLISEPATEETLAEENTEESEETTTQHTPESKKEIIELLKSLVDNANSDLKEKVDSLKQSFYKIHKQEVENARKAFVEAGNAIENFIAEEDALENDFKETLNGWREKACRKTSGTRQTTQNQNLEKKTQIIEDIKSLTDSTEDIR